MNYSLFIIFLLLNTSILADTLSDRLSNFSQQKKLHGSFVETWRSGYLNEPLISKGELSYQAPGRFRKVIEHPEPVEQIIKGNRIYISRDGETEIVQLSNQKNLAVGIYALRDVLEGNESSLLERFKSNYSQLNSNWVLELEPRVKQKAKLITLHGQGNYIQRVLILYHNGDSSLTEISNDILK